MLRPRTSETRDVQAQFDAWKRRTAFEYAPWLTVRDLPSRGVSHRLAARDGGRSVHLLSNLERAAFLVLDRDPDNHRITEQFPLSPSITIAIAKTHGVRHPSRGRTPIVMTSDLVCWDQSGRPIRAVHCKYASALSSVRAQEKRRIEEAYWGECGVQLEVWTSETLNSELVENLVWLCPYRRVDSFLPRDPRRDAALAALYTAISHLPSAPLSAACLAFDEAWGWAPGTSLAGVRYALARRIWAADLSRRIDTERPPAFLRRHPDGR